MKKAILIVSVVLLLFGVLLCFSACDEPETPPVVVHRHKITREELKTDIFQVTSEDPELVRASLTETGDLQLTAHGAGTVKLTLRNHYGEMFYFTVDVNSEGMQVSGGYTPPERAVFVTDFGAIANDDTQDTDAIQKAIDSLKEGGTVYFPKGVYLVSQLILREGVDLRLEGQLQDYTLSYEASGAMELERAGQLAILRSCKNSDMFLNHPRRDYGRNGCSNFTISGGMLDMEGKARCFVLSCGENITLENIILKDCPNNHAIQLGGCQNVTIQNCMFAGYNYKKSNTGAEMIQIEQTHPGAMGNVTNTPSVFDAGEIYVCSNITISGCYFGASNEFDAPTYAIGHHGQAHRSSVTGLTVKDCVFDNCRCSAIHYAAFSDVIIRNNTFINDRDNSVSPLEEPSQIMLFLYQKDAAYETAENTKVIYAPQYACEGSLGTQITDNRFVIGMACNQYSAVNATAHNLSVDGVYETGLLRSDWYTEQPVFYTGYVVAQNKIADLTVSGNRVEVSPLNTSRGFFFHFNNVRGLTLEDNTVQGKVFMFCSTKFNGTSYENCNISSCTTPAVEKSTFIVQLPPNGATTVCTVSAGGQNMQLRSSGENSPKVTVKAEGGTVTYTLSDNGDLILQLIPDEGKSFQGWRIPDTAKQDPSGVYLFTFSAQLVAEFQ